MKLTKFFTMLLFASVACVVFAQNRLSAPDSASAPVLLELFTSEGCSSCPPADALLRSLNGKTSPSGQLLIALSEHVTYWNQLGWYDPFSAEQFTARQNAYGERFNLESVYTPQLVVNGRAQMNGANRDDVERAIAAQSHTTPALSVHIVSSSVAGGKLSVTYSVLSEVPESGVDLFAVVADDLDQSQVPSGENRGRALAHAAVARNMVRLGRLRKPAEGQQVTVPLPKRQASGGAQHLVLFAQLPNYGAVLGADAQPIVRPDEVGAVAATAATKK